jgi:GMP synthase-like glutamine amidotransferase
MRVRVFQHVPFEGIGSIQGWMDRREIRPAFTRLYAGDEPPHAREFDSLIIMGGPMSVNDSGRYPWLAAEKRAIAAAVDAGRRVLGICLGAQLIAGALGCRVFPNAVKEIGWFTVYRADAAPNGDERDMAAASRSGANAAAASGASGALPDRSLVFQWHGETFDLPPGAVNLFSSDACAHQAFQLGEAVLALQFHLETTMEGARALLENCAEDLVSGPDAQGAEEITASPGRFTVINRLMDAVLDAHLLRAIS